MPIPEEIQAAFVELTTIGDATKPIWLEQIIINTPTPNPTPGSNGKATITFTHITRDEAGIAWVPSVQSSVVTVDDVYGRGAAAITPDQIAAMVALCSTATIDELAGIVGVAMLAYLKKQFEDFGIR